MLWGWKEIAAAVGVSINKVKELHAEHGLPVYFRPGPQATRANLQLWADGMLIMGEKGVLILHQKQ